MRRIALAGLAAATAMLGGIAPALATAPQASAATLPTLHPTIRQVLHNVQLNAGQDRARAAHAAPGSMSTANTLLGDSCASTTMCMAVGVNQLTLAPVTETFNGRAWSSTSGALPVPSGTDFDFLQDVSCRPTSFCVAVGGYETGNESTGAVTDAGLAEIWNGSSWTDFKGLTAGSPLSGLTGVSCVNSHQCVAVGVTGNSAGTSGNPVADVWNGSAWTRMTTPKVPSGSLLAELDSVSCWSAAGCIASGEYLTGSSTDPTGEGTLTEEWNGSGWTILKSARVGLDSWLDGLQCLSASYCMAVGAYQKTASHQVGLAERWNGKSWTAVLSPSLADQGDSELGSVSCLSPGDCNAVGVEQLDFDSVGLEIGKAAAAHWNGSSLSLTSPAGIAGNDDEMIHVSCKAANFCAGVGAYGPVGGQTSADTSWFWNSSRWKLFSAV